MPISNKMVGIDLGLTDLFITSDGKKSGNPRHTLRYQSKLPYYQKTVGQKEERKARDINAAINIKAAGLAVLACGATGTGMAGS